MLKQAFQYLLFTRANNGKWAWEHDEYRKSCPGLQSPIASAFHLHSQWDEEGVISEIQRQVSELIGNPVHGSVHLDESGFLKSGDSSVGVKRQYCSRFGKVENCQVGVFLGYALWDRRTLIDKRLSDYIFPKTGRMTRFEESSAVFPLRSHSKRRQNWD